jgi:hypothetical protein
LKNDSQYEAPWDKNDTGGSRPVLKVEFIRGGEKELLEEIEKLENTSYTKEKYTVIKVTPIQIQVERKINIGIKK